MTATYCESNQYDYNMTTREDTVNFEKLKGLVIFCDKILNSEEKEILLKNMQSLLSHNQPDILDLCSNTLFSARDYDDLFSLSSSTQKKRNDECRVKKGGGNESSKNKYQFVIPPNNPIISNDKCFKRNFHTICVKGNNIDNKRSIDLYNRMHYNYKTNIENVLTLVYSIIDIKNSKITLKDLTNIQVDDIEKKCKLYISKFYVQSISDTQRLLDHLLKLKSVRRKNISKFE